MTEDDGYGYSIWDIDGLGRLVVQLRRHGVLVHEATIIRDDVVAFSFEPHLAQVQILEELLLNWPGVGAVQHAGPRVLRVHRARSQDRCPRRRPRRVLSMARLRRTVRGW